MYETNTFEYLLDRMLTRVPFTLDKREGSIIYDALAPAAAELAQMYMELDINLNLSFADTASGEFLERRASDFGLRRRPAAPAQRRAIFYDDQNVRIDVPLLTRYSASNLNFKVIKRLEKGEYTVECETPGVLGNQSYGNLLPIDYVQDLARAELAEVLIPGTEAESDDALRARYLARVQTPSSGGNVSDYKNWALEVSGVGAAKVNPLWNGPGTVKVVVVDAEKKPPATELVLEVRNHIEQLRPIGANVTVSPATGKEVAVAGVVTLAQGYTLQHVVDAFTSALNLHFQSVAFNQNYLSLAKIGTILLDVPGVTDYSDLKLNGQSTNVALGDEEVPVVHMVNLGV
ncbi:baseplate J/gp47 family protein [Paenibacillus sp. GCM10012307]|uniref:Baseplate J/gp47 family protein n=1 Tax=Paenibacillus roseus TaxID=2798579 RepID=A0A934J4Z1_9BACL|nr:baseplate J/gp47 family protein [Paenibacillus roseus]MBJ6360433.1 baseplate J/gp47 family protein [Paenibacillus roseus]